MKLIPILFKSEMIRAILDGSKTQTRRVVKKQPSFYVGQVIRPGDEQFYHPDGKDGWRPSKVWKLMEPSGTNGGCSAVYLKCPYGEIASVLWVREEHYRYGTWREKQGKKTKTGRQKWEFIACTSEVRYCDNPPAGFRKGRHNKDPYHIGYYKRLARFMPKAFCRLWLEIKSIRLERLQDISEGDAIAEGIEEIEKTKSLFRFKSYVVDKQLMPLFPITSYKTLWQSINGPDSWQENKWVWAIEFIKTVKP